MTQKNFLIGLAGLPSSGKSTFAKLLRSALNKKYKSLDVKIIDPDIIRHNLTGKKFDYNKEYLVKSQNLEAINNELKKGNIVISDDLNYYSSMRHDLKQIADSLNLQFFIIYISTPPRICVKWNEKRGKPIPNSVINRIHNKFDKFNKYKWDNPIAKFNLSKTSNITDTINIFLNRLDEKLKENVEKEKKLYSSNIYNENLDKLTRIYVRELLSNPKYLELRKRIIKLRKNYVKLNKNKFQTDIEITRNFKKFLENNLYI